MNAADGVPAKFRVAIGKLSRYLNSNENPDVLLLGSSLWLFPSTRCDDQMAGKATCYDEWWYNAYVNNYDKSLYFQKQLKDSKIDASVRNLAVSSSLVSDQNEILRTAIESGKHPKLIVCGLCPRDFIDAGVKEVMTPTRLLLDEFKADRTARPSVDLSVDGINQAKADVKHHFEKSLARARGVSDEYLRRAINHPESVEKIRLDTTYRPNTFRDLKTYKRIYGMKSREMLARQTEHLRKLTSFAKEHGVSVLLINMPLTSENTKNLDQSIYRDYVNAIQTVAKENHVAFLDLGSNSKFDNMKDFEDSCHLGISGGKKLFDAIVDKISQDPYLLTALSLKQ